MHTLNTKRWYMECIYSRRDLLYRTFNIQPLLLKLLALTALSERISWCLMCWMWQLLNTSQPTEGHTLSFVSIVNSLFNIDDRPLVLNLIFFTNVYICTFYHSYTYQMYCWTNICRNYSRCTCLIRVNNIYVPDWLIYEQRKRINVNDIICIKRINIVMKECIWS